MDQDNTVAIVAIAVSGGVALIAAVIAPAAAHYRHRRALRAESERQRRQLAHDRLLRDVEETRTRLDEVIDMGEAAMSAVFEARVRFQRGDIVGSDGQLAHAAECLGQYGYKERRVRLRIGHHHALISHLGTYREKIQSLYDFVYQHFNQRTSVPVDGWNSRMAEVAAAQVAVIEAAEESVGARIEEDDGEPA